MSATIRVYGSSSDESSSDSSSDDESIGECAAHYAGLLNTPGNPVLKKTADDTNRLWWKLERAQRRVNELAEENSRLERANRCLTEMGRYAQRHSFHASNKLGCLKELILNNAPMEEELRGGIMFRVSEADKHCRKLFNRVNIQMNRVKAQQQRQQNNED